MRRKTLSRWLAAALSAAVALTSIPMPDVKAAETTPPLLLNLDFNSEAVNNVFVTDTAKATAPSGYQLQEKAIYNEDLDSALYLNGSGEYLNVTKADGTPLLAGKEEITISYDAKVTKGEKSWPFYAAPTAAAPTYPKEHYMAILHNSGDITVQRYDNANGRPGNDIGTSVKSEWMHVDVTIDETTTTLYLNGQEAGSHTSAYKLSDILEAGGVLQIGKANWESGEFYGGLLDNFRIYDGVLSTDAIAAQYAEFQESVDAMNNTSEADLVAYAKKGLKAVIDTYTTSVDETEKGKYTKESWTSFENVLNDAEAVCADANATRTDVTNAKAAIESAYKTLKTVEKQFEESFAEVSIANANDVRNDLGLVKETRSGATVSWKSSNPAVITDSDADENSIYDGGIVTRPEAGTAPVTVTLTATVSTIGADDKVKTGEKTFEVTVKPKTADLDTDYTAGYFWPHFDHQDSAGNSVSYEKIFFGYSEDGLTWGKLNKDANGVAKPVLVNDAEGSDLGVRDPHLIRSVDGDKYWLIGTDLHAEGGGAGGSGWNQLSASQNIVVWESNDLVTWSEPRIVYAGFDTAGCVWAPEAYYDEVNGDYVVYWSIRDYSNASTDNNALRVYVCRTRDFNTFSDSKVWLSEDPTIYSESGSEINIIDTSIVKDGNKFYRFSTSDWNTIIDVSDTLDTEDVFDVRENELYSEPNGSWYRLVTRSESSFAGFSGVEGLTVYQLPDGRWCAMGDNGGYVPFITDDLASAKFTKGTANFVDGRFRHGSVIRLSKSEEAALFAAYGEPDFEPGSSGGNEDEEPVVGGEPVLEYTFEEVTGTKVTDTATGDTNEDNATLYGSATVAYDEDRNSNVLVLNGSKTSVAYAEIPKGFFDGRDTVSISMDVKMNSDNGNSWAFTYGLSDQIYDFVRIQNGNVRNAITVKSYQNEREVKASGASADTWQNIVVVINGTNMKLYLDGSLVSQNTNTGITTSQLGSNLLSYIGKSFYSADPYFSGSFDNIKVYDRVLGGNEILEEVAKNAPLLKDITVGTVPARPAITKGTDDHTAVRTKVDKDTKVITSYVRKSADLSAVPVTLDLFNENVTATIDGKSFTNGSKVDLTKTVQLVVKLGDKEETYTLESPKIATNPVLPGQYADPDIDFFDGKYWIYPTTDGVSGWGGTVFHAWSSKDLTNWTDEGVILDVQDKEPGLNEKGNQIAVSPWSNGNAWAPTIEEVNGKYYFAYCGQVNSKYNSACVGSAGIGNKAIGIAVADNPEGPFVAQEMPLVYPTLVKNSGCGYGGQIIDPGFFTDDDGTVYLLFGNGNAGICQLDFSGDEVKVVDGSIRKIEGMTDHRESPNVIKRNGVYHFTWSCDDTGSPNYHVNYGIIEGFDSLAEALAAEKNNKRLTVKYKYTLLQKNVDGDMLGTAHQSVYYDEITDECYIAYHRFYTPIGIYTDGLGYHRETCVDEITFDATTGLMNVVNPTMEGVYVDPLRSEAIQACKNITVSSTEMKLNIGEDEQLTVSYPEGFEDKLAAVDMAVEGVGYSSSNESVASVTAEGKVTALTEGTTEITVTISFKDGMRKLKVAVTVETKTEPGAGNGGTGNTDTTQKDIKVTDVKIDNEFSASKLQLAKGKKATLSVSVAPSNAALKDVEWISSKPSIATVTVNKKGKVEVNAKKKGTTTITALAKDGSGVKDTLTVKVVTGKVKKIKVTGSKNVKAGKTVKLKAKVTATKGANKKVIWISKTPKLATVASNGKVKVLNGAKKGKKIKIVAMATDGTGVKTTFTIKVKK